MRDDTAQEKKLRIRNPQVRAIIIGELTPKRPLGCAKARAFRGARVSSPVSSPAAATLERGIYAASLAIGNYGSEYSCAFDIWALKRHKCRAPRGCGWGQMRSKKKGGPTMNAGPPQPNDRYETGAELTPAP
ncbi:MAG: hypothetical protein C5B50_23875, partial [Verrucomicrobia bacterium]